MRRRDFIKSIGTVAGVAALLAGGSLAQESTNYPAGPVKMIVPFSNAIAKSAPDGYTLGMIVNSFMTNAAGGHPASARRQARR